MSAARRSNGYSGRIRSLWLTTRGRRAAFRCIRAAVLSAALLSACGGSGSDGPPPSLSVSVSSVDIEVAGGEASVSVSNSGGGTLNWTASIPGGVGWARISAGASGSNAGTVRIEVDSNSGDAREFDLTITAGGGTARTVTIRQPDGRAIVELSAATTDLDGDGGSVTLQVRNTGHAQMPWGASLPDDVDWAYIESGDTGTDSGEIVVRYALNGGEDRELEVTVTSAAASNSPQSLALSQDWFGVSACTYEEAREEVYDIIRDVYYFNDEPQQQATYDDLVPGEFSSIDALLAEIHWMPDTHDRGFTYWLTQEESEMLFSGEAYIFGFRMSVIVNQADEPLYLEVLDVYADSPAGEAGLTRGDKIRALNGKPVDGLSIDQLGIELGPNEDGYEVQLEVENLSGVNRTFRMAKRLVDIRTVPEEHVAVFDTGAGKVGYLHFRTFFGDANARLLEEFAGFKSEGVRHLIVDLRYNGGGSVPIAEGLATLIGGPELFETPMQTVLARRIHNLLLELAGWNETTYFGCGAYPTPDLVAKCENESALPGLENVVFITSGGSASASELVITALQPHENVALVGERTYGKPVGQYGFNFCLEDPENRSSSLAILWPVSFATVNSEGFEEYYEGIPVTSGCDAQDDRSRQLGDAEEDRIAAALRFIETGRCGAGASSRTTGERSIMRLGRAPDPIAEFLGY